MCDYGFIRVSAIVPNVQLANPEFNAGEICKYIDIAKQNDVSIAVFPELSVTGYSCGDLFSQNFLIESAEKAVSVIKHYSRGKDVTIVVGSPVRIEGRLYNCAIVIRNGNILGIVPKIYVPSYGEFYEGRHFSSGSDFLNSNNIFSGDFIDDGKNIYFRSGLPKIHYAGVTVNISPNILFKVGKATFAIEICEDLWAPIPPSSYAAIAGAEIILNLSASNELLLKNDYRKRLIAQQSIRTLSAYIYSSCGWGESTQDLVFAGNAYIYENGTLLSENERFQTSDSVIFADVDIEALKTLRQKMNTFKCYAPDGKSNKDYRNFFHTIEVGKSALTDFNKQLYRNIDSEPFIPKTDINSAFQDALMIQSSGLAQRLSHISCKNAIIGVSGGLDSTLALIVTVLAFDKLGISRKGILGITMPGLGTTARTKDNAKSLMEALGVSSREISISKSVLQHFSDIGHDPQNYNFVFENAQARERTQILMDVANAERGIVIGTGDLSELALGWATYNGDQMSMYGVNADIPKTLIHSLIAWYADQNANLKTILEDILDTPVSPELLPADSDGKIEQITEELVGPYKLHDFFLYNFMKFGYSPAKIKFLAMKAFANQYDITVIDKWLKTFIKRFFNQQFKRSCMPDGPKICSVSLSPRGDWRMPSDANANLFLNNLD